MEHEIKYLDFILRGFVEESQKDGIGFYVVVIEPETEERVFIEYSFISGSDSATHYAERRIGPEVIKKLSEITFAKAKARIVLEFYEKGQRYEQLINRDFLENKFPKGDENHLQYWLLKALQNLRKSNPSSYKKSVLDVNGFCIIFSISHEFYYYCADLLVEKGFVKTIASNGINLGMIFITSIGIDNLNKLDERHKKVAVGEDKSKKSEEVEMYDIAISYAGENRNIAESIVKKLKESGISVFFDSLEKSTLWGKNLYDYLSDIYQNRAHYCIMLISEDYKRKSWTSFERRNAQARAFRENREYILPVKLDNTIIPSIPETIAYVRWEDTSLDELVELVKEKLRAIG